MRDGPLLLSQRRAAKLLGVSRDTLAGLRRSGRIRVVPWLGGFKIPRREVERLAAEGLTPSGQRPRAPRRRPPTNAHEAIMALDLDAL